jgi:hypothetical protein
MRSDNLKPIIFYVTAAELDTIKAEAEAHGVTVSYFVRALIDQYSPIKLPPLKRGAPPGNRNNLGKRREKKA